MSKQKFEWGKLLLVILLIVGIVGAFALILFGMGIYNYVMAG